MKKLLTDYGVLISIISGTLAITGAMWASDFRPAIAYELKELAAEFHEDKLQRLKKQLYDAKALEHDFKEKRKPVPQWLRDEIIRLEREIKSLEKRLD